MNLRSFENQGWSLSAAPKAFCPHPNASKEVKWWLIPQVCVCVHMKMHVHVLAYVGRYGMHIPLT